MEITVGEAGWRNEAFAEDSKGKMLVFFHTEQVKHNFESKKQNRPVYVPKVFIKKLVPGDNRLMIDRPMRETDMEEFPVEWARFEQKKAALVVGTPIDAWPILSDTQKAEFRALNIFTIDQFANLPDSAGERIMGFLDLRTKARGFILASKDAEMMDKVRAETDAKLAAQDAEMQKLREQIAALTAGAAEKPKRTLSPEHKAALAAGRKKKDAVTA